MIFEVLHQTDDGLCPMPRFEMQAPRSCEFFELLPNRGMGDVVGLMKDFEDVMDEKRAEQDAKKLLRGELHPR